MRDSQQAKVYGAEQMVRKIIDRSAPGQPVHLHGSTLTLPPEVKFGSLEATQAYVDRVLGPGQVKVRERKGNTKAHYEPFTATIAVPAPERGRHWAQREIVILHEIAHHLTRTTRPAHGPEFCAEFLRLVHEYMGPEIHLLLLDALHQNGVSISW